MMMRESGFEGIKRFTRPFAVAAIASIAFGGCSAGLGSGRPPEPVDAYLGFTCVGPEGDFSSGVDIDSRRVDSGNAMNVTAECDEDWKFPVLVGMELAEGSTPDKDQDEYVPFKSGVDGVGADNMRVERVTIPVESGERLTIEEITGINDPNAVVFLLHGIDEPILPA